jgi:hypothetical protein
LLVQGTKTFRVSIPDDAKVTFGPWSPPTGESRYSPDGKSLSGTLRVYQGSKTKATESILAVFTDVRSFRDLSSIDYEEQVIIEKGSTIWESDRDGYKREEAVKRSAKWEAEPELLESGEDDAE